MTPEKLIAWFEEIAARNLGKTGVSTLGEFYGAIAIQWMADAESALRHAFPPNHALLTQWTNLGTQVNGKEYELRRKTRIDAWRAIFKSALAQLKAGYLETLADGITAENTGDLLDQADALLPKHHLAAAVIAGGALETFVHHLCVKNSITWKGNGSIAAYQQALAEHRKNSGTEVISLQDEKQLIAWGGLRNDAAHTPLKFLEERTAPEVSLFVAGVRQFISKHT